MAMSRAACGALRRHLAVGHLLMSQQGPAVMTSVPGIMERRFETTHAAKKAAAKKRRTELWEQRQERKERLKTRRAGRPMYARKNEFKSWFDSRRIFQRISDKKARQLGMDWSIRVAAIVERLPVITPDKPQWEKDYLDLRAYLDTFGPEYPEELGMETQPDDHTVMSDEEMLELLPFTPAPRETEADKNGDVRTLNRRLKTRVYLAVLPKEAKFPKWRFPTVDLKDKETLLDGAKRAVTEAVGTEMDLWCPSNCPMAVDMNVPPEDKRVDGKYGTKIFFMRLQHDEGNVSEDAMTVGDYAWLDRTEFTERALEERGEGQSKFYHYLL